MSSAASSAASSSASSSSSSTSTLINSSSSSSSSNSNSSTNTKKTFVFRNAVGDGACFYHALGVILCDLRLYCSSPEIPVLQSNHMEPVNEACLLTETSFTEIRIFLAVACKYELDKQLISLDATQRQTAEFVLYQLTTWSQNQRYQLSTNRSPTWWNILVYTYIWGGDALLDLLDIWLKQQSIPLTIICAYRLSIQEPPMLRYITGSKRFDEPVAILVHTGDHYSIYTVKGRSVFPIRHLFDSMDELATEWCYTQQTKTKLQRFLTKMQASLEQHIQ